MTTRWSDDHDRCGYTIGPRIIEQATRLRHWLSTHPRNPWFQAARYKALYEQAVEGVHLRGPVQWTVQSTDGEVGDSGHGPVNGSAYQLFQDDDPMRDID